MKILESRNPGMVKLECQDCGRYFEVADFRRHRYHQAFANYYEDHRRCPKCLAEFARRCEEQKDRQRQLERLAQLSRLKMESGIPEHYALSKPPVRFVAEWIYHHRDRNLLLSGRTGTGKSTSACFVAVELLKQGKRISYTSLRALLDGWRKAKTSDWADAPDALLEHLCRLDVLIVDEMVEKARVSESGQELLFELLERVYNGECRARVWLLGNFYAGSLEEIFDDAEPVRRRLQESFLCGVIDLPNSRINPIDVWSGRK